MATKWKAWTALTVCSLPVAVIYVVDCEYIETRDGYLAPAEEASFSFSSLLIQLFLWKDWLSTFSSMGYCYHVFHLQVFTHNINPSGRFPTVEAQSTLFFSFYFSYLNPCSRCACHPQLLCQSSWKTGEWELLNREPLDEWSQRRVGFLLSLTCGPGLACRPSTSGFLALWLLGSLPGGLIGAGHRERVGAVYSPASLQVASSWPPQKISAPESRPSFPCRTSPPLHFGNCCYLSPLPGEGRNGSLAFTNLGCTCGFHTACPHLL